MKLRSVLAAAFALCLGGAASAQVSAPYVQLTGTIQSSNGLPAYNYGIAFLPTQVFIVAGTGVIVNGSTCATDTNGGVVGIRNPLQGPVVNVVYSGTLPLGNYYIEESWRDAAGHLTLVGPEIQAQLTMAGSLQVSPPSSGAAAGAVGMNIYIGTSSGGETLQGQTVTPTATFTQSTALTSGAAVPSSNTTQCMLVANDAGWPSGTGYNVTLTTPAGNTAPGYPQVWQFLGGGGATYNLSNGLPTYNGRVIYPVPVLTMPYNHSPQSISGPISLTGYNLYNVGKVGVGTALPAWGVDVEGSVGTAAAAVNANAGYLVNGAGGTVGQCLASDGSYFDTPMACGQFYQTVQLAGTAQPQEPVLNFAAGFAVADDPTHTRTNVSLLATKVQLSLPSTTVNGNTCSSPVSVAMTGVISTSSFSTSFATNPTAATGWGANGGLVLELWPDAAPDTLDWSICNQTTGSITPSAITLTVGLN